MKGINEASSVNLPGGWEQSSIGALTTLVYRYPTYYGINYVENGVPEIRGELLLNNGEIETDAARLRFVSEDTAKKFPKVRLEPGDIVMSVRGTMGKIGLVRDNIRGAVITANLIRLAPRRDVICPNFFRWALLAPRFAKALNAASPQTTIKTITAPGLKELSLLLPRNVNEQRKIAALLSLAQRAVEQQERLLALTTELKKALLHQLFTHGLRHEPQKQTELGLIPQSWDVSELGGVADLINGFAFKSEDYVSNGVLNFRVVNIRDEGVIDVSNDTEFLPNEFMQSHKRYLLSEGDILVVMVGATRGKMGFIPKAILPALMNQNMWRIVPKSSTEMHRRYLYHFLTTAVPTFVREFSESARGFFKKSDFRSIKLPKPGFDEQREIAGAIDNVEQKLGLHRRKHAALSALFRTLLHELMTARIRVHNLDLTELEAVTGS